jgi:ribosome-binding protein aMBF1 (putative translation factor)
MENQTKHIQLDLKLKQKRLSEGLNYEVITKQLKMSLVTSKKLEAGSYTAILLVLTKISNYLEISLKETFELYLKAA